MVTRFKHWFCSGGCLFGVVKITNNVDKSKYKYSGYDIGFDSHSEFSLPDGGSVGKNVIFSGADMSSSVHIDNKGKDILILGKSPTRGLDRTTFTAEAKYSVDFTQSNRKFCLSLHYKWNNSFLFLNATKIYQFKAKDSEIKKYLVCLGNISKNFTAINMKKTGLSLRISCWL